MTLDPETAKSLKALLQRLRRSGVNFGPDFSMADFARLQVASHPYPPLPQTLKARLANIDSVDTGGVTYWPCAALARDGVWREAVYFAEAGPWFSAWGVWPDEDRGKEEIRVEDIIDIRESKHRLSARFASTLYSAGESGMGYTLFEIEYADGTRSAHGAGNAIDFVTYPVGKGPGDIAAVHPHEGRDSPQSPGVGYVWCLFSGRS